MSAGFSRRKLLTAMGMGVMLVPGMGPSLADVVPEGAAESAAGSRSANVVVRRGYADCRFGQLHYMHGRPSSGVTSKPTLILLHQNPSSSVEYEYLLQAMAEDREVYAFDTPGNGMSDWPPEPLDMVGYARAFSDGLSSLGLGSEAPVDVYGFHTGTLLGAELAIAEPQRVGRLVLTGIPYRTQEQRLEQLDKITSGPKLTDDGEEILKLQQLQWKFIVAGRDPRVPLERAARMYMEKAKPLDRYWWPYKAVWTYAFEERFPLISQPVLVVQPHEALLEYTRRAAKLIQNMRFVELPDLERDVLDVGVDELARELRLFLT